MGGVDVKLTKNRATSVTGGTDNEKFELSSLARLISVLIADIFLSWFYPLTVASPPWTALMARLDFLLVRVHAKTVAEQLSTLFWHVKMFTVCNIKKKSITERDSPMYHVLRNITEIKKYIIKSSEVN